MEPPIWISGLFASLGDAIFIKKKKAKKIKTFQQLGTCTPRPKYTDCPIGMHMPLSKKAEEHGQINTHVLTPKGQIARSYNWTPP